MRQVKHTLLIVIICLMLLLPILSSCGSLRTQSAGLGFQSYLGEEDSREISQFWEKVRPMSSLSTVHYRLGCFYQRQGKYILAVEAFSRALRANPDNIKAYSGLGIAYDALQRYDEAQKAYQVAISLSPEDAYLYNNLGFSLLQQGKLPEALATLTKAEQLDGQTERIKNNLALTRQRLAEEPTLENLDATGPPQVEQVAGDPPQFPLERVLAVDDSEQGGSSESQQEPGGQEESAPEPDSPPVAVPSPPVLEAYGVLRQPVEKLTNHEPATTGAARKLAPVGLEVSNGNGVTGMARRSAGYLRDRGLTVRRITNAENFRFGKTTVFYQDGYLQEAYVIAALLPGDQEMENRSSLDRDDIQIRVLLGRDLADQQFPELVEKKREELAQPELFADSTGKSR